MLRERKLLLFQQPACSCEQNESAARTGGSPNCDMIFTMEFTGKTGTHSVQIKTVSAGQIDPRLIRQKKSNRRKDG
jgi:hypothetical protein